MKKFIVALLFLTAFSLELSAQYFDDVKKEEKPEKPEIKNRVFFGGNFRFSIGSGNRESEYLEISPLMGYRFSHEFEAGVSFSYIHISQQFIVMPSLNKVTLRNKTYGPRGFMRYKFWDNYFIQTEYESLNTDVLPNDGTLNTTRAWVPGLFLGGGSNVQIADHLAFNFVVLYNLSYNDLRSPYISPFVMRGGIVLR